MDIASLVDIPGCICLPYMPVCRSSRIPRGVHTVLRVAHDRTVYTPGLPDVHFWPPPWGWSGQFWEEERKGQNGQKVKKRGEKRLKSGIKPSLLSCFRGVWVIKVLSRLLTPRVIPGVEKVVKERDRTLLRVPLVYRHLWTLLTILVKPSLSAVCKPFLSLLSGGLCPSLGLYPRELATPRGVWRQVLTPLPFLLFLVQRSFL